jgi:arginyl-tRNA synthetase
LSVSSFRYFLGSRDQGLGTNVIHIIRHFNHTLTHFFFFQLSEFQAKITATLGEETGDIPNPSRLCSYLFGLCQKFSSFYAAHNIKNEPDPVKQKTLLEFVKAFSVVLGRGLELLGIPHLERM